MGVLKFIYLLFFTCYSSPSPHNILLVTVHLPGHAHSVLALGEELATRGHNVSICSMNGWGMKDKAEYKGLNFVSAGQLGYNRSEWIILTEKVLYSNLLESFCGLMKMKSMLHVEGIVEYIVNNDISQWDVIIVEPFLVRSTPLPCIAKKNNITVIGSTGKVIIERQPWSFPLFMSGLSHNLLFHGRMITEVVDIFSKLASNLPFIGNHPLCKEVFNWYPAEGWEFPLIVHTVMSFDYPRTVSPMTHYVGPVLSEQDIKRKLPDDIEKWLQHKEERSVIYISMGSLLRVSFDIAKALIDGTMNTNYSVLWSLNEPSQSVIADIKIDKEKYYISSWTPQINILQHSSIAMAVLHGGSNGIHEALIFGIPCIVIPHVHVSDQYDWAVRVVDAEVGLSIPYTQVTSSNIRESIDTIQSSDEYHINAQKMSLLMKSAGGVKKAADLVELYSLVGYDHLIPAPIKYRWNWVQYYNIDVYITLLFIALTMVWLMVVICRYCCCRCCCMKKKLKQN